MKKIKIEIKHWMTGLVLFEYEAVDNTMAKTVLEAIKQKANLHYADLHSADLRYADLHYANLHYANLHSADLRSADLRYADLSSANLRSADLRYADLHFANLSSANLSSANLRSANLRSANLRSAKNIPDNQTNYYWHIHHETLYEWLTEPLRARINYIKTEKAKEESKEKIELRLKLLKPILGKIPTTEKGWERLHRIECKNCPWTGKSIFKDKI